MNDTILTFQLGRRQPFLWVSLALWSALALFAWHDGGFVAALIFTALAGLSAVLLGQRTAVLLDSAGVTCRTPFATHRMCWDEVERVETDGVTLALVGGRKQLPLAPRFFASEHRDAAVALLEHHLAMRSVPRVFNPVASRQPFRNTRVKAAAIGRTAQAGD